MSGITIPSRAQLAKAPPAEQEIRAVEDRLVHAVTLQKRDQVAAILSKVMDPDSLARVYRIASCRFQEFIPLFLNSPTFKNIPPFAFGETLSSGVTSAWSKEILQAGPVLGTLARQYSTAIASAFQVHNLAAVDLLIGHKRFISYSATELSGLISHCVRDLSEKKDIENLLNKISQHKNYPEITGAAWLDVLLDAACAGNLELMEALLKREPAQKLDKTELEKRIATCKKLRPQATMALISQFCRN